MERKHVKLIVYGTFVLFTFVIIYVWAQRGKNVDYVDEIPQVSERSKYDDKIEAYRQQEKSQRMVATHSGTSYFVADSILTSDGRIIANDEKKTRSEIPANVSGQADQFGVMAAKIERAQDNLLATADMESDANIQYRVARGERIYYDKQGRAYTKSGSIDERALGQAAVDQYLADKKTSDPVETEAQRRKRRIEESMGIRAIDGTKIPAVVHTTQIVGSGQQAVFRVIRDTRCGNLLIPRHTLLSAEVKISGNRVHFTVGSLQLGGQYYAVSLTGYSVDGGEGLALNISNEKKALNTEVKDATLSGVQRVIGSTAVGNAVSGIVRGVSRASDREADMTIKLIDNQPINFFAE